MRKGFTLIELMIVIAIIAIIAAIAIPNLLESRVTSNESAAGASLKSGVLPAQAQFQSALYADDPTADTIRSWDGHGGTYGFSGTGGDGIPDYAATFNQLAGGNCRTGAQDPGAGLPVLRLLPLAWNSGQAAYALQIGTSPGTMRGPNNSSYIFTMVSNNQNGFCATCAPAQTSGAVGRRRFAISTGGTVYGTAPTATPSELTLLTATTPFGASAPFQTPAAGWSPIKM